MSQLAAHRSLFRITLALLATAAATPSALSAQGESEPTLQTETARIKAQAELERARADRDRASADRIAALGLPSFEGKTTMGDGAGAMEATMLASHAVREAAAMIAHGVPKETRTVSAGGVSSTVPRKVIVLAGEEGLDFSQVGALGAEMDAIRQVMLPLASGGEGGGALGIATVISAATAAAGLLRSDTEVAALDLPALSNRILASMVAAELGERAIIPSAAIGSLEPEAEQADWDKKSIMQKINALVALRRQVEARKPKPADAEKPTKEEQAKIAPYTAALARFDAFFTRVTTGDDKGQLPLVRTARLDQLWRDEPRILRVYLDKAGGSRVIRKNIGTTLTLATPVKVSGGIIASYIVTNPTTGGLLAFDFISCRTTFTSIQSVQRGVWPNTSTPAGDKAQCEGRNGVYSRKGGASTTATGSR